MPNVIKHAGKITKAYRKDGTPIEREDMLLFKVGEEIRLLKQVDDDDHFLYQYKIPVSTIDLATKYHGNLPLSLLGPNVICTCGSDGVLLIEGPYTGQLICRSYAQFGKHQTSFKLVDGKLILDKKTESEYTADPTEIIEQDLRKERKF